MPAQADNDPSPSQSQPGPVDSQARDIADAYFVEQAKLFEYLQDRHERFLNRYNDKFHKFKKRATPVKSTSNKNKPKTTAGPLSRAERDHPKGKNSAESKPAESCVLATDIANTSPKPPSNQAISRPLSASVAQTESENSTSVQHNMAAIRSRVPAIVGGTSSQIQRRALHASSSRSAKAADSKAAVNPDALPLNEAVRLLRALEISNPSSSYNVNIKVHTTKSSLPLRGMVTLPHSVKRKPEVTLVFAEPESPSAQAAQEAGANYVGGEDLFAKVLSGDVKPTKVWATPGMMPEVSRKLARFLGPKGLMPVAKRGGVAEGQDLAKRVRESASTTEWKADKIGAIRFPVAKMSFPLEDVEENVRAFITEVKNRSAAVAAEAADASTSRKRSKDPFGIVTARLETTLGPSIELSNVA